MIYGADLQLADVETFHVAAFIKVLQDKPFPPKQKAFSPPAVKQHLAALRMLFDWAVIGQVVHMNLAHAVRGPKKVPCSAWRQARPARLLATQCGAWTPIG